MQPTRSSRLVWVVIAANLLTALVAVATNLATGVVPESWHPHLWIAWPVLGVLVLAGIPTAVRLQRQEADPVPIAGERATFSRRAMIARLRTVWIEGVLDRSLYRRNLIELGVAERPDLLKRPWDIVMESAAQEPRQLDRETALVDVVERHLGLLVLGGPGAGKTTMLLSFLEDLLTKAEEDEVAPIPVVFQLASWPSSGRPLEEWLVDELRGPLYGLPPDLARDWIDNDRVLPLLDGLDEVPLEHRVNCARAIDDFHQRRLILPLIVASRIADYDALDLRMSLGTALLIQPLTRTQTEEYLHRLGEPLTGLHEALALEPSLWELLRTPFLLNVAVRAYHGQPATDITAEGTPEHKQAHLITAYVDRAFGNRRSGRRIPTADAVRVLAFVARALGQTLETYLYVESVHLKWLPNRLRSGVTAAASIPLALLLGTTMGLVLGMLFGATAGIVFGVLAAAGFGGGLCFGEVGALRWRREDVTEYFANWAFGALMAVLFGLFAGLAGLVLGAVVGLVRVLSGQGTFWGSFGHGGLLGMTTGALLGLLIPVVGFNDEISFRGRQSQLRQRPSGAGVRNAAWSGGAVTALVGFPATVVLWTAAGQIGLTTALVIAITVGYGYSGRSVISYWLVRVLLNRAGVIPLRLLDYLDFAVDRTVMLKVGGGYMFTHRLLLEHFARLEVQGIKTSYLRDGLPAVDLRPHLLLVRARDEATQKTGTPARLLSYTASVLPADVWAPTAAEVAEILEANLLPHSVTDSIHPDEQELQRAEQVDELVEILRMIVAAEHAGHSTAAAVQLGELLLRESSLHPRLTPTRALSVTRNSPGWVEAETALELIAASDSVAAPRAAELLVRMRAARG